MTTLKPEDVDTIIAGENDKFASAVISKPQNQSLKFNLRYYGKEVYIDVFDLDAGEIADAVFLQFPFCTNVDPIGRLIEAFNLTKGCQINWTDISTFIRTASKKIELPECLDGQLWSDLDLVEACGVHHYELSELARTLLVKKGDTSPRMMSESKLEANLGNARYFLSLYSETCSSTDPNAPPSVGDVEATVLEARRYIRLKQERDRREELATREHTETRPGLREPARM
ncbi:hypothetical protein K3X48_05690 [Aliiroseovarius crassostreae]|uniref:Uncharacterized protein n=1 Tax=Aliiroseovarius crassostreae TaxID=154981 RepID=A0A9Q9HFQ7_9RHOB|nr:hypothetical protein [Aliiroseovarius crassostreae]UWP96470.1 hypothetical protein K3X48_05690 [Aliiroseovarius crassostreae]